MTVANTAKTAIAIVQRILCMFLMSLLTMFNCSCVQRHSGGLGLQKWVINVPSRAALVERCRVGLDGQQTEQEAFRQIRIGDDRFADVDEIGFTCSDSLVAPYEVVDVVLDVVYSTDIVESCTLHT